ncbi:MAG: hemerythrin domain-containing protein [Myxococcota bacterium]
MMEELSILLDEHQAMRRILSALERTVEDWEPANPRQAAALGAEVESLVELMTRFHNLKEETVLIHRLRQKDQVLEPRIICNLSDKEAVVKLLRDLAHGVAAGTVTREAAQAAVRRISRVTLLMLKVEEEVLYPAVYRLCSEDDIWAMSVEMDRAVDMDGRERRARLIAACGHGLPMLLQPLGAQA